MVSGIVSTAAGVIASQLKGEEMFIPACCLLWMLLSVGASCVGPFQGIAINSIPNRSVRTLGNSVSQVQHVSVMCISDPRQGHLILYQNLWHPRMILVVLCLGLLL